MGEKPWGFSRIPHCIFDYHYRSMIGVEGKRLGNLKIIEGYPRSLIRPHFVQFASDRIESEIGEVSHQDGGRSEDSGPCHERAGRGRNFIAGVLESVCLLIAVFCFRQAIQRTVSLRPQNGKNAILICGSAAVLLTLSECYFFVSRISRGSRPCAAALARMSATMSRVIIADFGTKSTNPTDS